MKKIVSALAAAAVLVFSASSARALSLTIDGDYYLGSVNPDTPAAEEMEAAYINYLITMATPSTETNVSINGHVLLKDFSRSDNTCADLFNGGACVTADDGDKTEGSPSNLNIVVSGWTYLLGKFGNIGYIWVVDGLDTVDLPEFGAGEGLSHYTRFNGSTNGVPDGGATLGLLGLAMLGVGFMRTRMR